VPALRDPASGALLGAVIGAVVCWLMHRALGDDALITVSYGRTLGAAVLLALALAALGGRVAATGVLCGTGGSDPADVAVPAVVLALGLLAAPTPPRRRLAALGVVVGLPRWSRCPGTSGRGSPSAGRCGHDVGAHRGPLGADHPARGAFLVADPPRPPAARCLLRSPSARPSSRPGRGFSGRRHDQRGHRRGAGL
jgi:hypothetical protein